MSFGIGFALILAVVLKASYFATFMVLCIVEFLFCAVLAGVALSLAIGKYKLPIYSNERIVSINNNHDINNDNDDFDEKQDKFIASSTTTTTFNCCAMFKMILNGIKDIFKIRLLRYIIGLWSLIQTYEWLVFVPASLLSATGDRSENVVDSNLETFCDKSLIIILQQV